MSKFDTEVVIGSEGMGTWIEPHLSNFLKVIFPNTKITFKNTEDCDLIVRSHFMTSDCMTPMNIPFYGGKLEKRWNTKQKPYIYWSGESWSVKESEYHTKYVHINSSNHNLDAIYLPYFAGSSYFIKSRDGIEGIRHTNKNRKHMLAYCSSHKTENREKIFNRFVELVGEENCHSFGKCYGKYKRTNRKLAGWDAHGTDLLSVYSEYNFVIAMENTNVPGYITEKIMNAYSGGAIPIYWGTSEVNEFFNKDSFVNVSDFDSIDECVEYVINMETEKIHWMMDQPIFNEHTKYGDIINIHKNDDFYEKNASKLLPLFEGLK